MSKKQSIILIIWLSVLGFLIMNFNVYLLIGLLVGIVYRFLHGSVISFALGLVVGILVVEMCKFITYKNGM